MNGLTSGSNDGSGEDAVEEDEVEEAREGQGEMLRLD